MFFLLRMAFWFSLVVLALPLDAGTPADGKPTVGPFQAMAAAREAIGDLTELCERKPHVCEVGRSAAHTVAIRAREGGRIAFDLMEGDDAESPDAALVTGTIAAAR